MTTTYTPQAGTTAARVVAHLQTLAADAEVANADLAAAVGVDAAPLGALLTTAMRHGLVVRVKRDHRAFWKLGPQAAPPPAAAVDDDADSDDEADEVAAPIARTVPSTAAAPIPGLVRQSWCPAALATGSATSMDDDPPPPPSPPAPKKGEQTHATLGWRAPKVPVFQRDAYAATTSPAAAPEPAGDLVESIGAAGNKIYGMVGVEASSDTAANVEAFAPAPRPNPFAWRGASVNDENVQALTAALAPMPKDDPDFYEVAREASPPVPTNWPAPSVGLVEKKGEQSLPLLAGQLGFTDDLARPLAAGEPHAQHEQFRCALWSNGMLDIRTTEGEHHLLNADDTRSLIRYVSEVLSARTRATA